MNKNMSDERKTEITKEQKQEAAESLKIVPYAHLLGFELVDLSANEAKIKLQMRKELRQPYGILHGGATASLLIRRWLLLSELAWRKMCRQRQLT